MQLKTLINEDFGLLRNMFVFFLALEPLGIKFVYIGNFLYLLPPSLAENNLQNQTPIVALRHDGVFSASKQKNSQR